MKDKESKKDLETKGIRALLVLEMIGKPAEHLTASMNEIIKSINEEKGIEIKEKKLNEPILMKDQKEFYTTFSEIEVEVEEILYLVILMFKYMPAHIEIISPELIALTNNGWNDILNELTRRLHGYDEIARVLQFQNSQMQQKIKELMPEEKPKKEKKKK